jgi:hypothetical protein
MPVDRCFLWFSTLPCIEQGKIPICDGQSSSIASLLKDRLPDNAENPKELASKQRPEKMVSASESYCYRQFFTETLQMRLRATT